ncbi:phosphoglycerate kinase [Pseudahrensia aquimaris]|uniref:Phosphoglycerate kinase n=1 Tax=Pseudahrensia aquimaris TaxID=744461 RepID=A0ABW3FFV9_9HYPH
MTFKTLDDLQDIIGKRVLVRVDINVPMDGDRVSDTTRIERVKPTIMELSGKGAKVILLAHYGRPKGQYVPEMSLGRIVSAVADVLGVAVGFVGTKMPDEITAQIANMGDGEVLMMENTRFHPGEESNEPEFAKALAAMGDIYVNDAFSAAHRAHASTEGIAQLLPSYAGRTMQQELEALEAGLGNPDRPVIAIVGGAKVSTKLDLLGNLVAKVDHLVIGGGMANTFLAALGLGVGKSLCEHDLANTALSIVAKAQDAGCEIILPEDVVVAQAFAAHSPNHVCGRDEVPSDMMILDAGPKTLALIEKRIAAAKTLVWNGPMGAFEIEPFDAATVAAAKVAAKATKAGTLVSIAGGGDTVAALNHAGVADDFTYVSTAGGAFLEWMEGKELPGVAALSA